MNKEERELRYKKAFAEAELRRQVKAQREGILYLTIILSILYAIIGHKNNPDDSMIQILLISVVAAFITTMMLYFFTQIMKNWFKW